MEIRESNQELIYFGKENSISKIRNLILASADLTCRGIFSKEYIRNVFRKIDFGFYLVGLKPEYLRRKYKGDVNEVNSFILVQVKTEGFHVELICSMKGLNLGKHLIDAVVKRARESKMKYISLYSLPHGDLIRWYMNNSFVRKDAIIQDGIVKAVLMVREIKD